MSYTREETKNVLLCNISDAAFRIKNNSEEFLRATGSIQKSFKMYIVPEGGHLNVGYKVSNETLTYLLADLFY